MCKVQTLLQTLTTPNLGSYMIYTCSYSPIEVGVVVEKLGLQMRRADPHSALDKIASLGPEAPLQI